MAVSTTSQKVMPCLWFNDQSDEAADFYVNLFNTSPQSKSYATSSVDHKTQYMKDATQHCQSFEPGTTLSVVFKLAGQEFMALNGGPMFKFTSAISLMVECKDQEEIDHFWNGFTEGVAEREINCGWCLDRYGLSWQVVPGYIRELVENEPEHTKYNRLHVWMQETMPKKYVLKDMKRAIEGENATSSAAT